MRCKKGGSLYIPPCPSLGFRDLARPFQNDGRHPLTTNPADVSWHQRGCGAIGKLLEARSVSAQDKVLLPSYLCREVVEAFKSSGAEVEYYGIDRECGFDLEELEKKIDSRTRLVCLVHYFGFPRHLDEVRSMTRKKRVWFVEDCAHALFGRTTNGWLGEFGDAAVFSLRKSLPVPDGGALLMKDGPVKTASVRMKSDGRAAFLGTAKLLFKRFLWSIQLPPMTWMRDRPGGVADSPETLGAAGRGHAMSGMSWRVLGNCDIKAISSARRSNFAFYIRALDAARWMEPLFMELPDGVVPLSFPVLVRDRDGIRNALGKKGIFLNAGFPEAASSPVPGTAYLARHLLELPVHQDLHEHHLQKIIDRISSLT